jgi:hypothetical protein
MTQCLTYRLLYHDIVDAPLQGHLVDDREVIEHELVLGRFKALLANIILLPVGLVRREQELSATSIPAYEMGNVMAVVIMIEQSTYRIQTIPPYSAERGSRQEWSAFITLAAQKKEHMQIARDVRPIGHCTSLNN